MAINENCYLLINDRAKPSRRHREEYVGLMSPRREGRVRVESVISLPNAPDMYDVNPSPSRMLGIFFWDLVVDPGTKHVTESLGSQDHRRLVMVSTSSPVDALPPMSEVRHPRAQVSIAASRIRLAATASPR